MTIWLHFITASHDFQAFMSILNSPDWHPGLNWLIIQSVPIQGIGWVFVDPHESFILQQKSWILHFAYRVPNENPFKHAFVWGFRIRRRGSILYVQIRFYMHFSFRVLWRVRVQTSGPDFVSHSAALVKIPWTVLRKFLTIRAVFCEFMDFWTF